MDDFTPEWLNKNIETFNVDKCSDKIKTVRNCVMSLENIGLSDFIRQFEVCDLQECSQYEFNQIFHNCLPKDIKNKVESQGVIPFHLNSKDYLNKVSEVVNKGPISCYEIDTMLERYVPTKNTIIEIYEEYKRMINNLPDTVVRKNEKDRRIHGQMIKYLPSTILSILKTEESWNGGAFSPEVLKRFLTMHQQVINWNLQNKKYKNYFKKTRINRIENESASESEDEKSQSGNYDSEDNELHVEDYYEFSRVNKIEKRTKRNMDYTTLQCTNCKKLRHTEERCIFNKDPEIRFKNQKKIGINICLKCRSTKHVDRDCDKFDKISILACARCNDNGKYEYHHTVNDCVKNNFLEKHAEGI